MILLSDDYQGKNFCKSYVFDVLARTEIEYNLDLIISKEEIKIVQDTALEEKSELLLSQIEIKNNKLLEFISEKQFLDLLEDKNRKTIDSVISNLDQGETLTDENLRNLINKLAQNLT